MSPLLVNVVRTIAVFANLIPFTNAKYHNTAVLCHANAVRKPAIAAFSKNSKTHRPVNEAVQDIARGAGGSWFDSRASQIRQSVANGSPPLRRFVLLQRYAAEIEPATRYTLWRNAARIMMISQVKRTWW